MTVHPAVTNYVPMRTSPRQTKGFVPEMAAWPIPALIDRALCTYCEWRETADAVADTYARWCAAAAVEEAARFAAYMGALGEEKTAAAAHAASIREFERWLPDAD
jgi:hypothetical protein